MGEDPKSSNLAGEAKVLCQRECDRQMRGTELVPENILPGILDAVAMIDGLFVSSPPGACAPTGNTYQ